MKCNPLVSIIVNNYNYGRFLGEAIGSALDQTYPHTEVIVVDDGSTDDSREVIAGYGDRVTPVLKENGGQASAFNAGFRASQGEIVIFLDADDYLFAHAVEQVVAAWEPGVSNVQYRLEQVDACGKSLGSFDPPRDTPMESGEVWRTLLKGGYYRFPPTSGLAHSRTALEHVFPVPEANYRIAADGYLATLLPFYGRIKSIEEALGAYRTHGSNFWKQRDLRTSSEKYQGFVQHDLDKQALIAHKAKELGHRVPRDFCRRNYAALQTRLILLRLAPRKHPIASDRPLSLVYWGLRAIWRYSRLRWKRRLRLTAWFVCVGLLPSSMAKSAIVWIFDPQSRPGVIKTFSSKEIKR